MTETSTPHIDPNRPWIQDERDDPARMDWVATMFNPFGTSSKLHFTRAWSFMFLGRVLLYVVPTMALFILGVAGGSAEGISKSETFFGLPMPRYLWPFLIFVFVTEFTSFVAHIRRLGDGGRPTGLAFFALLPLTLYMLCFAGGSVAGAYVEQNPEVMAQAEASETEASEASEASEGTETDTATEAESEGEGRREGRGQRGNRGGPPSDVPIGTQISSGAAGLGMALWCLSSFGVMLWTLLYVARIPNGGKGRFSTGSDAYKDTGLRDYEVG